MAAVSARFWTSKGAEDVEEEGDALGHAAAHLRRGDRHLGGASGLFSRWILAYIVIDD